jgi:YD repeat-containing protein
LFILGSPGIGACRDCARPGFGGPGENRFTPYDALCKGAACRDAGFPQGFVNAANLTLFVRVTDLAFGGPAPALTLEHSFNMDDTRGGVLGTGWSFSLGDTITTDPDGTLVLRRGSGRTDRFATAAGSSALFPVTSTTDSLTRADDGTYTLRAAAGPATRVFSARIFSADGRLLSIQDGGAVRVALDYDSSGHLSAAHYRGKLIGFATDTAGRITSIKDAAGRSVSFTYNGQGRLAQQTNADGQTTAYEYDAAGNATSIAWSGGKTAIAYSGDPGFLSVASVTTPDGAVRQYDTPNTPEEIRVTDGNGDATWYTSTALGLLQTVADSAGNTVTYAYDAAGNRIGAVNGAGETVAFTYDARNNLTGITDGANNRWSATYTAGGAARITDPNKNVWTLTYDDSGNLASVTDPRTFTVLATRNAAGQIVSLADPKGNTRGYQYNADGLMTGFTDALGNKWAFDYDGAARPSAKTDPSGNTLKATYTPGNRIASLTAGGTQTGFDYSGIHRDNLNQLSFYIDSDGVHLNYFYDAAGQLRSITVLGGGGDFPIYQVVYEYDHLHRLSKVSDLGGNFALYRYDAAGWPVSVSVSGGPVTINQYDGARNLRAIVSTGPDGTPVAGYRFTVDANGNRTAVSALEPNTSTVTKPASLVYSFDAANRPISRSDGATYQYDARGNLSAIAGASNTQLAYDAFGRLQSLAGDVTGTYGYDATGLRTVRNDRSLIYDVSGDRPRVIAERDHSSGPGAPIAWYVYGLGLLWKVIGGIPYFYHFDGDGNTVALSNPTKGVVNTYRYDAQGRLVAANEGVENMFRAHGESGWMDEGNGLLFTGSEFQFPELRLTLPATADPSPPVPGLQPQLSGVGACFFEGVANCLAGTASLSANGSLAPTGGRTR